MPEDGNHTAPDLIVDGADLLAIAANSPDLTGDLRIVAKVIHESPLMCLAVLPNLGTPGSSLAVEIVEDEAWFTSTHPDGSTSITFAMPESAQDDDESYLRRWDRRLQRLNEQWGIDVPKL